MQPAIGVDGFRRFLGLPVVTLHDLVPADADLAQFAGWLGCSGGWVDDLELITGQRPATHGRPDLRIGVEKGQRGAKANLCHAEARHGWQQLLRAPRDRLSRLHAGRKHAGAQAAQVARVAARVLEQLLEMRVKAMDQRDPLGLDEAECLRRVEPGHQHMS